MKRFAVRIRRILPLALLVGGLLSPKSAEAMPPLARDRDGVVISIDQSHTILTVQIEGESRPRSFEWNDQTWFFRHGKFTSPTVLKPGAAVRIRYRAPFFGKPFVSQVTLLNCPRCSPKIMKQELPKNAL